MFSVNCLFQFHSPPQYEAVCVQMLKGLKRNTEKHNFCQRRTVILLYQGGRCANEFCSTNVLGWQVLADLSLPAATFQNEM